MNYLCFDNILHGINTTHTENVRKHIITSQGRQNTHSTRRCAKVRKGAQKWCVSGFIYFFRKPKKQPSLGSNNINQNNKESNLQGSAWKYFQERLCRDEKLLRRRETRTQCYSASPTAGSRDWNGLKRRAAVLNSFSLHQANALRGTWRHSKGASQIKL